VDYVLLIVMVLALQSTLGAALRRGADSPNWELRWSALAPADRARITTAARSRSELADPEGAELVAGFNRRRERRSAYFQAPAFFLVAAFTALSLVGLGGGFAGSVLAATAIASGLWSFFGEKRLNGTPRAATTHGAES
jgi:hypothetical protein